MIIIIIIIIILSLLLLIASRWRCIIHINELLVFVAEIILLKLQASSFVYFLKYMLFTKNKSWKTKSSRLSHQL